MYGLNIGQVVKALAAVGISMFAGTLAVQAYFKPLSDMNEWVEQAEKQIIAEHIVKLKLAKEQASKLKDTENSVTENES